MLSQIKIGIPNCQWGVFKRWSTATPLKYMMYMEQAQLQKYGTATTTPVAEAHTFMLQLQWSTMEQKAITDKQTLLLTRVNARVSYEQYAW